MMASFRLRLFLSACVIVMIVVAVVMGMGWTRFMQFETTRLETQLCSEARRLAMEQYPSHELPRLEGDIQAKLRLGSATQLRLKVESTQADRAYQSAHWEDVTSNIAFHTPLPPKVGNNPAPPPPADTRPPGPANDCTLVSFESAGHTWRAARNIQGDTQAIVAADLSAPQQEIQKTLLGALAIIIPLALVLAAAGAYASIINSMTPTQKAYIAAMKGKGWNSWPNITDAQVATKLAALPQGSKVAVMTYASDIYSWYAGSLVADVYFCPERHGTYYGGFYIKDAPAVGHEGYSIDEQMTATAGAALVDSSKGYVTASQASTMYALVAAQKDNLNAIVAVRTRIAALLRSLLDPATNAAAVKAQVLSLSATYGELDGANNHAYATTFAQVYKTLSADQKTKLATLRKSMMSGKYADGTVFDFSVSTTPFLYSAVVTAAQIAPYISDAATTPLFFEP